MRFWGSLGRGRERTPHSRGIRGAALAQAPSNPRGAGHWLPDRSAYPLTTDLPFPTSGIPRGGQQEDEGE